MTAPDVIVIGGGVIGLSCAWRAAEAGMSVRLFDPSPGEGASKVGAGMLAPVTEAHYGEERLLALNLESARLWPAFAAELEARSGMASGYRACGSLAVAFDADDQRALDDLARYLDELDLDARRLSRRELREAEPLLAPRVRGGLLVAGDHQVDNRLLLAALSLAAEASGVDLRREAVQSITLSDARVSGVIADSGRHVGPICVLAAGCWSSQLEGLPAGTLPAIRPVKGQILRLRQRTSQTGVPGRTVRATVRGHAIYVVPRDSGEVVVGATLEEQGYDTTVTAGAVHDLLRDAVELVPALAELELVEASAGLRPATADNFPLIGQSRIEGLLLATGHYRNGFLLAPVTAQKVVSQMMTPVAA